MAGVPHVRTGVPCVISNHGYWTGVPGQRCSKCEWLRWSCDMTRSRQNAGLFQWNWVITLKLQMNSPEQQVLSSPAVTCSANACNQIENSFRSETQKPKRRAGGIMRWCRGNWQVLYVGTHTAWCVPHTPHPHLRLNRSSSKHVSRNVIQHATDDRVI